MRKILLISLLVNFNFLSKAQVKVFKEVSEDVSSEMKTILQNEDVVGYLVFTKLEQASEDSFNYRISLMDENLNDIGIVNFREENINLEAVSFEQDVLCLAYLKSNIIGKYFKTSNDFEKYRVKNSIFFQFLTLSGKIINTTFRPIDLLSKSEATGKTKKTSKFTYEGGLKHSIQLRNISQTGFACFYGDRNYNEIVSYNLKGNEIWKKSVGIGIGFGMLTANDNIYLLEVLSGPITDRSDFRYYILSVNTKDGDENYETRLKDSVSNSVKVVAWNKDPYTNIPYISGFITQSKKSNSVGLFLMDFIGPELSNIHEKFIYWNEIEKNKSSYGYETYGKTMETEHANSFRDFKGNTYFIGDNRSWKSSNSPLIFMNNTGELSYEQTSDLITKNRNYYIVQNAASKETYIITEGANEILIYSVQKKKIVRTIPEKEGKLRTKVFPAKEGHLMIVETNKKEKYTRLSIELLD